jgi:hypothetical protein
MSHEMIVDNKTWKFKIALYEENTYHTEILGTFLYYCRENNIKVDYYNDSDQSYFYEHYVKLFNMNIIRYKNVELLDRVDEYKYILVGTMGKISKIETAFYTNLDKFICIFHNYDDQNGNDITNPDIKKLVMTPLNKTIGSFILPIFSPQIVTDRKMGKTITLVGRFKSREWTHIMPLVDSGYSIQIITRRAKMVPKTLAEFKHPNVKVFLKRNADDMMRIINKSNYLLCLTDYNSWYYKDRLSGIIALSFNYGVPLLMPKLLNEIYGFDCVVEYDTYMEIPNIIENTNYDNIVKLLNKTTGDIIRNNNVILNNIFI